MIPIRITPPPGPLVDLAALKAHLRVDGDEDDDLIQSLERSAVTHLDGWRGVLGRCIQSQQWAVTFGRAGRHRLPFPDVTAVSAEDGAGDPVTATLCHDAQGSFVDLAAPATVTLTAGLPEDAVEVVVMAVKLLVGHWYEHREAVVTGTIATTLPLAVQRLIAPVTVWRI